MSPGVPYVSVRSNDVLNGSLDLVLRLCTRVDTVWRVLRPGREVGIFLLDRLPSPLEIDPYLGAWITVHSHRSRGVLCSGFEGLLRGGENKQEQGKEEQGGKGPHPLSAWMHPRRSHHSM